MANFKQPLIKTYNLALFLKLNLWKIPNVKPFNRHKNIFWCQQVDSQRGISQRPGTTEMAAVKTNKLINKKWSTADRRKDLTRDLRSGPSVDPSTVH